MVVHLKRFEFKDLGFVLIECPSYRAAAFPFVRVKRNHASDSLIEIVTILFSEYLEESTQSLSSDFVGRVAID